MHSPELELEIKFEFEFELELGWPSISPVKLNGYKTGHTNSILFAQLIYIPHRTSTRLPLPMPTSPVHLEVRNILPIQLHCRIRACRRQLQPSSLNNCHSIRNLMSTCYLTRPQAEEQNSIWKLIFSSAARFSRLIINR